MRDRIDNRDVSPKYRDRHHHHDVDRHGDAAPRHQAAPRLVRVSASPPPVRAPRRRSPHRRDAMSRQPDHHKPMHRDYLSPHHLRSRHSPTARDYHHNLHVPSYLHRDYPTDLSHGIKHQPHGLDPQPVVGHKAVFLDDSELLHCHGHTRDLYGGERDRERERERETGKVLYQREVPLPVTVTTTHLGSIDGGQSSYGHGRSYYDALATPEDNSRVPLSRLSDDPLNRRESRDRVVLDEMYGKLPYQSLGYSSVDGMAYSPRSVREGRVYSDVPHHSTHRDVGPVYRGFEQGYSARSLHRHEVPLPFEERHDFHREAARVAQRERQESPIFSDRGKGLHRVDYIPPHNGYVDDIGYQPSHDHLRHVHDHNHDHDHVAYDDRIFDDDEDDVENDDDDDDDDVENDDDGEEEDGHGLNQRVTVKDRLNLSSPQVKYLDHPKIRRTIPFRKPGVIHGKHNHSHTMAAPAAMRPNSVKKRLWPGPLDLRKENFRAHKMQRREMLDEPNIRNVNYNYYEKGSEEDVSNRVSPAKRDPPEGTEEFEKQVEKAFLKYARTINESSREKKKFLQPGRGSLLCYACGRQSKEFAETHNLVVHTFHTQKPGLKTAHLGLQKALCFLMGWNWLITPDESKQYQAGPPGEAKKLKQDLILWPPIVVIRNNSSIDNNSSSESKSVSIEMIESMLKEMGIAEGKTKVSYGKPSNLNLIMVKFSPTLSGFELAEKLLNHFSQTNNGKGTSAPSNKNAKSKEIEDAAYMAGIDDLDKLDSDMKKTYLAAKDIIRSKKVIKAQINEQTAA